MDRVLDVSPGVFREARLDDVRNGSPRPTSVGCHGRDIPSRNRTVFRGHCGPAARRAASRRPRRGQNHVAVKDCQSLGLSADQVNTRLAPSLPTRYRPLGRAVAASRSGSTLDPYLSRNRTGQGKRADKEPKPHCPQQPRAASAAIHGHHGSTASRPAHSPSLPLLSIAVPAALVSDQPPPGNREWSIPVTSRTTHRLERPRFILLKCKIFRARVQAAGELGLR